MNSNSEDGDRGIRVQLKEREARMLDELNKLVPQGWRSRWKLWRTQSQRSKDFLTSMYNWLFNLKNIKDGLADFNPRFLKENQGKIDACKLKHSSKGNTFNLPFITSPKSSPEAQEADVLISALEAYLKGEKAWSEVGIIIKSTHLKPDNDAIQLYNQVETHHKKSETFMQEQAQAVDLVKATLTRQIRRYLDTYNIDSTKLSLDSLELPNLLQSFSAQQQAKIEVMLGVKAYLDAPDNTKTWQKVEELLQKHQGLYDKGYFYSQVKETVGAVQHFKEKLSTTKFDTVIDRIDSKKMLDREEVLTALREYKSQHHSRYKKIAGKEYEKLNDKQQIDYQKQSVLNLAIKYLEGDPKVPWGIVCREMERYPDWESKSLRRLRGAIETKIPDAMEARNCFDTVSNLQKKYEKDADNWYELDLMPTNNNFEPNKIYIGTKNYTMLDSKGKICEGCLADIDLKNVGGRLNEPELKTQIMRITQKNKHTSVSECNETHRKANTIVEGIQAMKDNLPNNNVRVVRDKIQKAMKLCDENEKRTLSNFEASLKSNPFTPSKEERSRIMPS